MHIFVTRENEETCAHPRRQTEPISTATCVDDDDDGDGDDDCETRGRKEENGTETQFINTLKRGFPNNVHKRVI